MRTWAGGKVKSIESDVSYTRHDGSQAGPLLRLEGDRIPEVHAGQGGGSAEAGALLLKENGTGARHPA